MSQVEFDAALLREGFRATLQEMADFDGEPVERYVGASQWIPFRGTRRRLWEVNAIKVADLGIPARTYSALVRRALLGGALGQLFGTNYVGEGTVRVVARMRENAPRDVANELRSQQFAARCELGLRRTTPNEPIGPILLEIAADTFVQITPIFRLHLIEPDDGPQAEALKAELYPAAREQFLTYPEAYLQVWGQQLSQRFLANVDRESSHARMG